MWPVLLQLSVEDLQLRLGHLETLLLAPHPGALPVPPASERSSCQPGNAGDHSALRQQGGQGAAQEADLYHQQMCAGQGGADSEGSLHAVPATKGGHGSGCHSWGQATHWRGQEHHGRPLLSGRLVQERECAGVPCLETRPVPAPPLADARAQSVEQPGQPAAAVGLLGCPALPDITRLSLPKKKAARGPGQHEGGSRRAKRAGQRRACMAEQSVGGISAASQ